MQPIIYSNRSQECERAESLIKSVQFDDSISVRVFVLDDEFTSNQFHAEFGADAEYPQIAIGLEHRGTLKETLKYMSDKGMLL